MTILDRHPFQRCAKCRCLVPRQTLQGVPGWGQVCTPCALAHYGRLPVPPPDDEAA